jgi:hypothetical protein
MRLSFGCPSSANIVQVVPENSAVLGLPNEMIIPLNAHHRGICRFPSSLSQNYILVEAYIKEIFLGKSSGEGSCT